MFLGITVDSIKGQGRKIFINTTNVNNYTPKNKFTLHTTELYCKYTLAYNFKEKSTDIKLASLLFYDCSDGFCLLQLDQCPWDGHNYSPNCLSQNQAHYLAVLLLWNYRGEVYLKQVWKLKAIGLLFTRGGM